MNQEGDLHVHMKRRSSETCSRPAKQRRLSTCPVAGCRVEEDKLRTHVYRQHIPTLFLRQSSGTPMRARLHRRRIQMLRELSEELGLEEVANLVDQTNGQQKFPNVTINPQLRREMEALCRAGNLPVPENGFCLSPLNSVGVFLHWRPLAHLLSRVSPQYRADLMDKYAVLRKPRPNAQAPMVARRRKAPGTGNQMRTCRERTSPHRPHHQRPVLRSLHRRQWTRIYM